MRTTVTIDDELAAKAEELLIDHELRQPQRHPVVGESRVAIAPDEALNAMLSTQAV